MIDSIDIKLPSLKANDVQGKIAEMHTYLYQLAEQLNWAFNSNIPNLETTIEELMAKDKENTMPDINITRCKNTRIRGDLLDMAKNMTTEFAPIEITSSTTSIPGEAYRNAIGYVHKGATGTIVIYLIAPSIPQIAMACRSNGAWTGWKFITL